MQDITGARLRASRIWLWFVATVILALLVGFAAGLLVGR